MRIGRTCSDLVNQCVQHPLVKPGIGPDAYILILVHLLTCCIAFEPLFNQLVRVYLEHTEAH